MLLILYYFIIIFNCVVSLHEQKKTGISLSALTLCIHCIVTRDATISGWCISDLKTKQTKHAPSLGRTVIKILLNAHTWKSHLNHMYYTDQDQGFHPMFLSVPPMARPWLVGTAITLTMSNNSLPSPNSQLQHDTRTSQLPAGTEETRSYFVFISTGSSTSLHTNGGKPSNMANIWLISVTNRHRKYTQEKDLIS